MTDIVEAIDSWVSSRYTSYTKKLYGFCELATMTAGEGKAPEIFPMTIPSNTSTARQKVAIDDRYNFITWSRWITPVNFVENSQFSWGKEDAREGVLPLRYVVAHKTTLGENVVFDFMKAFPSKFTISGYEHVFVESSPQIDPDHEAIIQTEVNSTGYEKHRFTWNVYVLNITIRFLECVDA